jgi:HSP20 family protein
MPEPITQDQPLADPVKQQAQADLVTPEPMYGGAVFAPQVDILETEDELTLLADMPGVDLDGVDIHFENSELTLYGRAARRDEGVEFIHREYGVGNFHRAFTIGPSIDSSKISAQLSDGVLTVHLPKTEAVKPRRIEVTAGY